MIKPFKNDYSLTQGFGQNPDSYARFGMKGHNGLDYGLPMGTEVIAPHSGKVIEAAFDATGYGNYLKIENDKEGSVLAHLKEFRVNVGDTITEGQVVGISNNTGNSTGPHLHWGYYLFPRDRGNGYAGFIDQINLLDKMATITQKELDTIRLARDSNYNDWKIEQAKNDTLEGQINALNQTISDKDKVIADLRIQLVNCQSQPPIEVIKEVPVEKIVYKEKIIDNTNFKKLSFSKKLSLLFS